MSEEEEETKRKLILFGRDVSEIPCFRNSYLYGISSGIGMGLTYFMFTSKVRMATHARMQGRCRARPEYRQSMSLVLVRSMTQYLESRQSLVPGLAQTILCPYSEDISTTWHCARR
uniref:Cytochrome c oxidase assembly protein COX20, mitochondrial n=1 Tax=Timema douglasi TaxID=61478 RepID=A0A7R8ZDA0_TIMDO|nr:unnamed protein product [Timema douglasi]